MSEYTPTTEEVCEIYWQSGYKTTVEQFDRWLAEVKAEAWDRCVGEMPIDPDWKNFYSDNNPYREETE